MKISLAKALVIKKRIATALELAKNDVMNYNSRNAEEPMEVDVTQRLADYYMIRESLIALKVDMADANKPINGLIFRGAELRGEMHLWKMNTKVGKERLGYGGNAESVVKTATYTREDARSEERRIQSELDLIQDQLNAHNHTTMLDIDDTIMTMI